MFLVWVVISPNTFREVSYTLGTPIWALRDSISGRVDESLKFRGKDKEELVKENLALLERVESLHSEVGLLKREIELLGGSSSSLSPERDAYKVILRPPFITYDMLIVSIPEGAEVEAGQKVSSLGGVFLGEVTDVFDKAARIRITSSSGEKLVASTFSGEMVELLGQGGGSFFLTIPKGVVVEVGDVFRESSTGMIAARVESVDTSAEDPFNQVYLSIPENIFSISSVRITTE